MNVQPVHFDAAYAATTEWKRLLVDSTFTLALVTGMSVRTVSAKVVANLGWGKVNARAPVFAGDTLYAESTILHKRESKSRPTRGIVTVEARGLNQDGTVVMMFERTLLVHKRGDSPEETVGYGPQVAAYRCGRPVRGVDPVENTLPNGSASSVQ